NLSILRMKALGCGDMSPLLRWRKFFNLCFATCKLALPKAQTCLRTPNAISAIQLIPDLNINDFICFQRLTDRDPQQRICLAQTKKRMGFLATDRPEFSVFEFASNVMRSIAIVR